MYILLVLALVTPCVGKDSTTILVASSAQIYSVGSLFDVPESARQRERERERVRARASLFDMFELEVINACERARLWQHALAVLLSASSRLQPDETWNYTKMDRKLGHVVGVAALFSSKSPFLCSLPGAESMPVDFLT